MMNFDDFRKDTTPAWNETEQQYFIRITSEYLKLCKRKTRQLRLTRSLHFLSGIAKRQVIKTNVLRA